MGQLVSCLNSSDGRRSAKLQWNESDRFQREVEAKLEKKPCAMGVTAHSSPNLFSSALGSIGGSTVKIQQDTDVIFGEKIPFDVRMEINAIRNGASVPNPYASAKAFWAANPGLNYTLDLNRDLATKYGLPFATQVFEETIRRKPFAGDDHKTLRKLILERSKEATPYPPLLGRNGKPIKLIISQGFGFGNIDPKDQSDIEKDFIVDTGKTGMEVTTLKKDPYGLIEDNSASIKADFEKLFNGQDDFILMAVSKGLPDSFMAMKDLKITDRLIGIINVSGLSGGTYLCDTANQIWITQWLQQALDKKSAGKSIKLARTLCEADMKARQATYLSQFPTDLPLIQVAGIPGRYDGFPERWLGPTIRTLFEANRRFNFAEGASDGVIEYPGILLPETFSKEKTFIVHGSHIIMDGNFEGLDFIKPEYRRGFFRAIAETLLEMR